MFEFSLIPDVAGHVWHQALERYTILSDFNKCLSKTFKWHHTRKEYCIWSLPSFKFPSQKVEHISHKDAHMACSHAHKFVTCVSNGISLQAVTCPCKSPAGWPFWSPYRNVRNVNFFSILPCFLQHVEKPKFHLPGCLNSIKPWYIIQLSK